MTWADLYALCFLVGFILSLVSFATGSTHLHVPHVHFHIGGGAHVPGPHAGVSSRGADVSPVNFGTVTAFLAWFGGAGYLMTHYYGPWFLASLGVAIAGGVTGAAIVFWFVAKVLVSSEEELDPADYEMVGVLGRLSSPIRAGGTGELIFSQAGTRRSSAARSEDGTAIAKGTEVVVMRYEKGVTYVRPWDQLTAQSEGDKHKGQ